MVAIVYLATNRVNGKRYVGATGRSLATRRRHHHWEVRAGKDGCRKFHRALRKHGFDAFDWSILETCDGMETAFVREAALIAEFRPEYNLAAGGRGSTGRVATPEQRAHHSRMMKGRKVSPETIAKLVAANTGRKRTPEQRERMGAARRGKPFSEEHRRALSVAHAGKKQSAEVIAKRMQSRLGKPLSAEHRAKISATLSGHPLFMAGMKWEAPRVAD